MTLPVPKLETPAIGPVPFCAPTPKAQGRKGGHPRKTMLSSTTGPTQTCPFCSAPYVEPAASTRLGVAHPPKNGESRSEAQPQPGPPVPTAQHPTPRLRRRPCLERAPPERLLAREGVELRPKPADYEAKGTQRGASGLEARLAAWSSLGARCLLSVQLAGWAAGASDCALSAGVSAPSSLLKPAPQLSALLALQTHVSKAVPVLDLAAVLRDGRQPLLVLHEITGGLALLEPFGVAFGQGGRGQEQ